MGRPAGGPINSPLFSGNDCGMGGNGLPSRPLILFQTGLLSSPGDSIFYLHHGITDCIWWIWQMQGPVNRMNVLPGNAPPTIL
jgi:hypothetical protein